MAYVIKSVYRYKGKLGKVTEIVTYFEHMRVIEPFPMRAMVTDINDAKRFDNAEDALPYARFNDAIIEVQIFT